MWTLLLGCSNIELTNLVTDRVLISARMRALEIDALQLGHNLHLKGKIRIVNDKLCQVLVCYGDPFWIPWIRHSPSVNYSGHIAQAKAKRAKILTPSSRTARCFSVAGSPGCAKASLLVQFLSGGSLYRRRCVPSPSVSQRSCGGADRCRTYSDNPLRIARARRI